MNLYSNLKQRGSLILACAGVLMSAVATPALAERAELAADRVAYSWQASTPGATHVVRQEGARWLRLRFDAIELPAGSVLRLTSLADGARQHLNATTAA